MYRRSIFERNDHAAKTDMFGDKSVPVIDPASVLPPDLVRRDLDIPDVGELGAVRHYSNLAKLSLSVDTNFYPLGSCTMKYNPQINEEMGY